MRSVCVFCGSGFGNDPAYRLLAEATGTAIAERGVRLVYGGGRVGLMGVVADAALAAGGDVIGVIPNSLMGREVEHTGLTELHVTATMHERKALMADLSDGFIAIPGGFGTLDELCKILTWSQLGIMVKPVAMLDTAGYWQPTLTAFDHAVSAGFLSPAHRDLVLAASVDFGADAAQPGVVIGQLLDEMATFRPVLTTKWGDQTDR